MRCGSCNDASITDIGNYETFGKASKTDDVNPWLAFKFSLNNKSIVTKFLNKILFLIRKEVTEDSSDNVFLSN